jgi:F-type H+-transporting ATPase subunit c
MASARMIVPKMASMMGSASVKAARPVLRSNLKTKVTARGFSGTTSHDDSLALN